MMTLSSTGETIEESISFVELSPEPVPVVRAKGISLAELRSPGISGNNLPDVAIDCGQQFRSRLLSITNRVVRRESFYLFHQSPKLLVKQRVGI